MPLQGPKTSTQVTLIGVPCTTQAFGYAWVEEYLLTMFAAYVSFPERESLRYLSPREPRKGASPTLLRSQVSLILLGS